MPNSHFLIVGRNDAVIYEFEKWSGSLFTALRQFIAYAALDAVEEAMYRQAESFLPKIHRPSGENVVVSAYVGLSQIRLLLIQDVEPNDTEMMRLFLIESYKICCQYLLSPFRSPNEAVPSGAFRNQLDELCKTYL